MDAIRTMRRGCAASRSSGDPLGVAALALLILAGLCPSDAPAHGFAGKRFFPATLATDDPFVADELSAPTVSRRRLAASGDQPQSVQTGTAVDLTKRITPQFGIGLGTSWVRQQPQDSAAVAGLDNLSLGVKYMFVKDDAHETIVSVGADWDIGGSGARRIGERFSTVTPSLFFGKGMGDLPESLKFLRPFAVTGAVGVAMPTRSSTASVDDSGNPIVEPHPDVLNLGLAIEYSVPYLQSFVKDLGLRRPFSGMIPVIEFALAKPLDRGGGAPVGTVNPGVIWVGRYLQLGLEATLPINGRTGGGTGIIFQVHFFLDDIFPRSVGRPIFGARR